MRSDVQLAGTTFLIAEDCGDVSPDELAGLFTDDARHLSTWELRVDGCRPRLLTARRDSAHGEAVLSPAVRRGEPAGYVLLRAQAVEAAGLVEQLRLRNLGTDPVTVEVRYLVGADFADQFELRSDRDYDKPGAHRLARPDVDGLSLEYRRDWFQRRTRITTEPVVRFSEDGIEWTVTVRGGSESVLTLRVSTGSDVRASVPEVLDDRRRDLAEFTSACTVPESSWEPLDISVHKGLCDLAVLRVPSPAAPDSRVPGAGAPWFLTLYGRDSLVTSLFALPYAPRLAAATLRAHAANQGSRFEAARCEEPGKIVHEVRVGELSQFGQVPYAQHYGTVDATPLFLMLLGAYYEMTGDDALVVELRPAARAAIEWMFGSGGLDTTGYLVYPTDGPGFMHHGWKESAEAICFASGEIAKGPIALCEAQGYAFDALCRTAELARTVWQDPNCARRLSAAADALCTRFAADFWLSDAEFPALALDCAGRQVDALASNAGHLLWTGLLSERHAARIAERLTSEEFFSGWGIRTLAAGQLPFHPLSYHNGSVWPHDTAIAVAGLARYGRQAEAERIATGLLAAAEHFQFRLPEVMAGFAAHDVEVPVPYPHSCSPQAWASAAPLALHTALER